MGVQGLWTILSPCARPVKLETLAQKRLAVDASIWIYQFLKAVRDKEGNALRNSHVVGFFRRICKLLFFGIKPVFVFDGGAPALKRATITGRKMRREGRREDAIRTAGRLLAMQMKRRAEGEREQRRKEKEQTAADAAAGWEPVPHGITHQPDPYAEPEEPMPTNPVYVEELTMTPQERHQARTFRKTDPYHLPDLDMSLSSLGAPNDPRIMSPEDLALYASQFRDSSESNINLYDFSKINFSSPFFLSLPLSDQYAILNAARLRSRLRMGLSKEQLATMFPDRLEFSKFQIERVRERNELTQRLMNLNGMNSAGAMWDEETGMIGGAGGGRVAGEKGREYVLVKNDGVEGGWVLGVVGKKEGVVADRVGGEQRRPKIKPTPGESRNMPILLDSGPKAIQLDSDNDDEEEDDDGDFEDVPIEGLNRIPSSMLIPRPPPPHQRDQPSLKRETTSTSTSLFIPGTEELHYDDLFHDDGEDLAREGREDEDEEMQRAIALSMIDGGENPYEDLIDHGNYEDEVFNRAVDLSKIDNNRDIGKGKRNEAAHNELTVNNPSNEDDGDDDEMDLDLAMRSKRKPRSTNTAAKQIKPLPNLAPKPSSSAFPGPLPFESLNPASIGLDFGNSLFGRKKTDRSSTTHTNSTTLENNNRFTRELHTFTGETIIESQGGDILELELENKETTTRLDKELDELANAGLSDLESENGEESVAPGGFVTEAETIKEKEKENKKRKEEQEKPLPLPPWFAKTKDSTAAGNVADIRKDVERERSREREMQRMDVEDVYEGGNAVLRKVGREKEVVVLSDEEKDDSDIEMIDMLPSKSTRPQTPKKPPPVPQAKELPEERSGTTHKMGDLADVTRAVPVAIDHSLDHRNGNRNTEIPSRRTSEYPEGVNIPKPAIHETEVEEKLEAAGGSIVGQVHIPSVTEIESNEAAGKEVEVDENGIDKGEVFIEWEASGDERQNTNEPNDQDGVKKEQNDIELPSDDDAFDVAIEKAEAEADSLAVDPEDEDLLAQIDAEFKEHARFANSLNHNIDLNPPSLPLPHSQTTEEYEQELRALRIQQKKDRRDADEVTHTMVSECQQLLRLFGLPYITAPMEAEAQCAELVRLGLVDGIVTDDSDIFLFGGTRVYKNMFNQAKFVECFLASDLEREVGLDQRKLISLAHLLGSDYTEGLPGVGPVTAVELLSEFSDRTPPSLQDSENPNTELLKFRDWFNAAQVSPPAQNDPTVTKFRKKFLKANATKISLPASFPDKNVNTAYLHPEVDSDPSKFEWGVPDLDGLRRFLMSTIGWSQERTDEVLVPVVRDMNRRLAEGTQSNITRYFDGGVGAGAFAPRRNIAKKSRRLEIAVGKLNAAAARCRGGVDGAAGGEVDDGENDEPDGENCNASNTQSRNSTPKPRQPRKKQSPKKSTTTVTTNGKRKRPVRKEASPSTSSSSPPSPLPSDNEDEDVVNGAVSVPDDDHSDEGPENPKQNSVPQNRKPKGKGVGKQPSNNNEGSSATTTKRRRKAATPSESTSTPATESSRGKAGRGRGGRGRGRGRAAA